MNTKQNIKVPNLKKEKGLFCNVQMTLSNTDDQGLPKGSAVVKEQEIGSAMLTLISKKS